METLLESALDLLEVSADQRASISEDISFHAEVLRVALATPPVRINQLVGALNEIEELAARLADLVERYDENVSDALGMIVWQHDYCDDNLDPVLLLSNVVDPTALRRLSRQSGAATGAIVNDFGSGDPDQPDRGGPPIETKLFGTPKRRFVEQLVWIWSTHRRDALSETPGGLLHRFCEYCWQWATDDAEAKGIADDLRRVVPRVRKRVNATTAMHANERLAANLRRVGRLSEAQDHQERANGLRRFIEGRDD